MTTEDKLKDEIEIIRTKGCPQCICENSKDKYVENCEDCLLRIGYLRGKLKGYQQAKKDFINIIKNFKSKGEKVNLHDFEGSKIVIQFEYKDWKELLSKLQGEKQ
jgi:hypothetical protein